MKKILLLLLVLLLAISPVLAENAQEDQAPVLPAEIIEYTNGLVPMSDALTAAKQSLAVVPAECLIRAELVRMNDASCRWIVTIFDISTFYANGWCMAVDAVSGEVVDSQSTDIGYFAGAYDAWVAGKGPRALWSLEDKQLYDCLYTVMPSYGQPVAGDMAYGDALSKAIDALQLTNVVDYQVGYGYLMGSGDGEINGVWEVYFVQNGETMYKVNLDAVTGEIYYIEPDEEGNG